MSEEKKPKEFEVDLTGKKTPEQIKFSANEMLVDDPKAIFLFVITKEDEFIYISDLSGLDFRNRLRFKLFIRKVTKNSIVQSLPEIESELK